MKQTHLLLSTCMVLGLSVQTHAAPWKWKGFEILGNPTIARTKIEALIPIQLGADYQEDTEGWKKICADIEKKLALAKTECSAVRFANFEAYFTVDVIEKGSEHRLKYRPDPTEDIALTTPQIRRIYSALYKRLWELFDQGKPPQEITKNGFLDYTDPKMHKLAEKLARLVPPYRENILSVLKSDRSDTKRADAANLLNWTKQEIDDSIVRANALLDDRSIQVRNNISRFTSPFLSKVTKPDARKQLVSNFALQLDRPSHADRNKALYNLLHLATEFPDTRESIRHEALAKIETFAKNSILENVQTPAAELLRLLEKPASK